MPQIDDLSYTYNVGDLAGGASLGNNKLFIDTDVRSNLTRLWSSTDNLWYCGAVEFRFSRRNETLLPMVTRFFPAYQETIYGTDGVILSHRIFAPHAAGYDRAVCWLLEVQTEGPQLLEIAIDIQFVPDFGITRHGPVSAHQLGKTVNMRMERGVVVAETAAQKTSGDLRAEDRRKEIRIFGSSGPPTVNRFVDPGRVQLLYHVLVEGYYDLPFVLGFSPSGEQVAWHGFLALSEITSAFGDTEKYIDRYLTRSRVVTPDAQINRGLQWAKVNILRSRQQFRRGPLTLHDAPGDVIGLRDVFWGSMAGSYLDPKGMTEMLRYVAAESMYETGKIADHFCACADKREDFGLNVNDATPLFIIAVTHHMDVTCDDGFLDAIYPAVQRAADYLVLQVQDGLISCVAEGVSVYGIPGWRNQIPGYKLDGKVTEINALGIWALRSATCLAEALSQHDHAERWRAVAGQLTESLNQHLVSRETGFYMLAKDAEGQDRTTLTGDLVFSVLADTMPGELKAQTLDLLHGGVFWSEPGVHAVGINQPEYHPTFAGGMMGGRWPALTAWVAYAGRRLYPEHVARALKEISSLIEIEAPSQRGNLVPGQIPEWLHGTSGESEGRSLNMRSAAACFWLGIEGLVGLRPRTDGLVIEPAIPKTWNWLAALKVPYAGRDVTLCMHDGTIHANYAVDSDFEVEVYDNIEHLADTPCFMLLLTRDEQHTLFAGSVDRAVDSDFVSEGKRWTIKLAPGEAVLLH